MTRRTVDDLLAAARERLDRLEAREAARAAENGALLVDIRSEVQRAREGVIPGALHHPRNVLEWRADPASEHRDPRISEDLDRQVVLVCDGGYQSSLAAATLKELGFANATDLVGGFQAWKAAGLPVEPGDAVSPGAGPTASG
jgi:rhodanese-related sulfurtransferase